ncbi:hypothetical protein BUE61_29065, partial [Pseudomonas syringae pv. actinidiae]
MHTLIYLLLAVLPAIAMAEKNDSPPANSGERALQNNLRFKCHREADVLPPVNQDADTGVFQDSCRVNRLTMLLFSQ